MPDTARLRQIAAATRAVGPDQLRAHAREMRQISPAQFRAMNSAFKSMSDAELEQARFCMMSDFEQAAEAATVEAAPAENRRCRASQRHSSSLQSTSVFPQVTSLRAHMPCAHGL